MINNKKSIFFAMTIVIAGLLISASIPVNAQEDENQKVTYQLNTIEACATPTNIQMAQTLEKQERRTATLEGTPLYEGITPCVSSDESNVCLGFQDPDTVWFTGSVDGGITWPENAIGYEIDAIPEIPDVDACGDGRFIGGMVPNYLDYAGGALYKWSISDITDFSATGYGLSYWTINDLGDGYTDIIDIGVAGYTADDPGENTWAYGAHTMQLDYGGVGPQPSLTYQANEEGLAWFYTFGGDLLGGDSTSADIDPSNKYLYSAWNYYDDQTQQTELLVDIMDFATWEEEQGYPIHPEIKGFSFTTSGNDENIDISAQSDNVILVSERDGMIVGYYAKDGFAADEIFEMVIDEDGEKPRIVHTDDLEATCIFVRDGELFSSTTEDGGDTWSAAEKVSGDEDVIVGDVASLGVAYESDDVVYFSQGGGDFPVIGIDSIDGGLGVTATISNTGTADAVDVPYEIKATGGLLGLIDKSDTGTISVAADSTETISLGIIIGLGAVTIEVTVGSVSETVSGTQLLIFTNI